MSSIIQVLIFFLFFTFQCQGNSVTDSNIPITKSPKNIKIVKQKKVKREYTENEMQLLASFKLEEFKTPLYRTYTVYGGENGTYYLFDNYQGKTHRISFDPKTKTVEQFVFGRGKGEGPGEISQLIDMKIHKDRIFLADAVTNSIEVYKTSGEYERRINFQKGLAIYKICPLGKGIVIAQSNHEKSGFLFLDSDEQLTKFGHKVISDNVENTVFHDFFLSEPIYENKYYYFPIYLGFAVKYNGSDFLFAKETIDGLIKPENVRVKLDDSKIMQKVNARFFTAICMGHFKDYILLKSADKKLNISNWDIYKSENFEYIASIRNPPAKTYSFSLSGDILACLSEEQLTFFSMSRINEELGI